jgi:hypothetical protein
MINICEAHSIEPDPKGVRECYGGLWVCAECKRTICTGFGCADEYPDLCDDCWWEKERPHGEKE